MNATLRPAIAQVADADLRLLRVFRAVVECGGFSAAAIALDVARSTVSTHVASLETRLGLRLCERGRGGFSLSDPGRLVYTETVRLMSALDEFRSRVNAAHRRLVGELNVGVIDNVLTLTGVPLVSAFDRFRAAAPEVHVALKVLAADEIERSLAAGSLHAGIYAPHRQRPDLDYRELTSEVQRLYCAAAHPLFERSDADIVDADIEDCDFVGRSYLDEARAMDRPWRTVPTATANNLEAILILVLSGRYLGLLPEQYAVAWCERGEIRAVCPDRVAVRKTFALVTRKTRSPAPVVSAFLTSLGVGAERSEGSI